MFDDQDRLYFAKRASECRRKASGAIDPAIREIHSQMAEEYERRARGEVPRPVVRP